MSTTPLTVCPESHLWRNRFAKLVLCPQRTNISLPQGFRPEKVSRPECLTWGPMKNDADVTLHMHGLVVNGYCDLGLDF